MKKIFLFIVFLLFASQMVLAQKLPVDTIAGLKDSLKNITVSINQIKDSINKVSNTSTTCPCQDKGVHGADWLLVFTPILLFLILVIFLLWSKGLSGFDFKGALAENELAKITIPNKQYNEANLKQLMNASNLDSVLPPTIEINGREDDIPNIIGSVSATTFRPSISRYIALFSGMLTVIIAVCMASFFIYHYIRTGCAPDLGALSTVLIALGIGVAPYAVNKISSAVASRKTDE